MLQLIVAYDGTPHAQDALTLGRWLRDLTGGSLGLAHVHQADPAGRSPSATVPGREAFLRRAGERLLEDAPAGRDGAGVSRHAIAGATTATALRRLAESEHADVLIFGSARNGPVGLVHPGSAARRLMHSAGCAIAFAPAGLRDRARQGLSTIAFANDDEAGSARRTAESLAARSGAAVIETPDRRAQLLVLGSRRSAQNGRVTTAASAEQLLQASRIPAIVLAHGVALASEMQPAQAA
jgi:nucleotide-binding universal stress UspA family protein